MLKYLIKRRKFQTRAPTLNTVLMVEETLQKAQGVMSIPELKRVLPKQVMHQTLVAILDYLEYSGKITVHNNNMLWTLNDSPKLKKYRQSGIKVR